MLHNLLQMFSCNLIFKANPSLGFKVNLFLLVAAMQVCMIITTL